MDTVKQKEEMQLAEARQKAHALERDLLCVRAEAEDLERLRKNIGVPLPRPIFGFNATLARVVDAELHERQLPEPTRQVEIIQPHALKRK